MEKKDGKTYFQGQESVLQNEEEKKQIDIKIIREPNVMNFVRAKIKKVGWSTLEKMYGKKYRELENKNAGH